MGSAANFTVCWENTACTESNCVKVAGTDCSRVDARVHISHLTNSKCKSFLNNVGFFELMKAEHSSFYCLDISKVILYYCAEESNEVIWLLEVIVVLFKFRNT